MMTLEEVAAYCTALDGVAEVQRYGRRAWGVGKKVFAWERPFSKADLKRFGDETPPSGDIVAVSVGDLHEKEAILAAGPMGVFTISHFAGYAAVLVQLDVVTRKVVHELLTDAHRGVI